MRPDSNAKFMELPITSIKPNGWLRRYLEIQRDGLTGYLDEAVGYPFNTESWCCKEDEGKYENWWPYEQNGYWIDAMIRCGYLIEDEFLIQKAKKYIDYVLDNADEDGYLGPNSLKSPGDISRWPHSVFFRAMIAYYSATQDERVLSALTKHYLSGTSEHSDGREVCNVEIMLWLYGKTGDKRILECAVKAFEEYNRLSASAANSLGNMLSDEKAYEHGVTFNEIAKLGAILYMYTGDEKSLKATVNAYRKIDRDQMLIDGVCSSSEYLRGKDPLDSHETCDIADFTWSVGYLLMATGNAEYADKIERACFNAAPGAVRSDFKGLQYFSCPNQVIADRSSNHNTYNKGEPWMSYRPDPANIHCCPGEVNRIMPNYAARMWMSDGRGGLAAVMYGPCTVTAKVGYNMQEVTIEEETSYPFSERIQFRIKTESPVELRLILRIPGWCSNARLLLNGSPMDIQAKQGSFVEIKRTFSPDDCIALILPMELKLSSWPYDGVGIERGPLVYALRIEERWEVDEKGKTCSKEFPAWNLYADSEWNYAVAVDGELLDDIVKVVHKPMSDEPWSICNSPIELHVPARKVRGWELVRENAVVAENITVDGLISVKKKGNFVFTPQLPLPETLKDRLEEKAEYVVLVPYGCTKLRISIFPKCRLR
ncbi:MAG TPA: hypothetical protein GXX36_06880 [Clostridiaceae bacterium]|nr:hypothetical protein [Clostridiaceae bacterium]